MRSGTTWWHWLISTHPEVVRPPGRPKELHFFDRVDGDGKPSDEASYYAWFPRPNGMMCGEWTPKYIVDSWVPPMLARTAPDAKLLVLLRDPLTRLVSALTYIRDKGTPIDDELVRRESMRSLYWEQLTSLHDHFPREQVLILQYERCVRDMPGQLARTFAFLGLDPARLRLSASHSVPRNACVSDKIPLPAGELARLLGPDLADRLFGGLPRLLADFPEIDPRLWPSVGGHSPS